MGVDEVGARVSHPGLARVVKGTGSRCSATFRQGRAVAIGPKRPPTQHRRLARSLLRSSLVSSWLIRLVQTLRVGGILGATAFAASALVTVATSSLYAVPQTVHATPIVPAAEDSEAPTWASSLPAQRGASESLPFNPFCPTCRPEAIVALTDAALPSGLSGRASTLPLRLYATMEADEPLHSQATISNLTSGQTGLFGIGDAVGDGATIVAIASGIVHIDHRGALEFIAVSALPEAAAPPRGVAPSPGPKAPAGLEDADEAIGCNDDYSQCEVERSFVDELLQNPTLLISQGNAMPGKAADGTDGFVLSRIRGGSLPQRIGLQNGDVIVAVAGRPATLDNLSGLYGSLRRAEQVTFEIERSGKRLARALQVR